MLHRTPAFSISNRPFGLVSADLYGSKPFVTVLASSSGFTFKQPGAKEWTSER